MSFFSRVIFALFVVTVATATARAQDEEGFVPRTAEELASDAKEAPPRKSSAETERPGAPTDSEESNLDTEKPAEPASSEAGVSTASALGAYSARPLALPKGTLRIDVAPPDYGYMDHGLFNGSDTGSERGVRVSYFGGGKAAVGLGVGAAYGITDGLEAGALFLPFFFAPDFNFGDTEVYGRYAFVRDSRIQLGAQAVFRIPTYSDFGMGFGIPALIRLSDTIRLDTGLELEMVFADHALYNLDLPIAVNVNLSEEAFIGGRSGLVFVDFKDLMINLGIQGGYTVASVVDLTASLNFPAFFWTGHNRKVKIDFIQFVIGANIYFNIL